MGNETNKNTTERKPRRQILNKLLNDGWNYIE